MPILVLLGNPVTIKSLLSSGEYNYRFTANFSHVCNVPLRTLDCFNECYFSVLMGGNPLRLKFGCMTLHIYTRPHSAGKGARSRDGVGSLPIVEVVCATDGTMSNKKGTLNTTYIPASVPLYAPGIDTVAGDLEPPPVTRIWAHSMY